MLQMWLETSESQCPEKSGISFPHAVHQGGGQLTPGELTASAASGHEAASLLGAPPKEGTAAAVELTAFANNVDLDVNVLNEESEGTEQDVRGERLLTGDGKGTGELKGALANIARTNKKVPATSSNAAGKYKGLPSVLMSHPYEGQGGGTLPDANTKAVYSIHGLSAYRRHLLDPVESTS